MCGRWYVISRKVAFAKRDMKSRRFWSTKLSVKYRLWCETKVL